MSRSKTRKPKSRKPKTARKPPPAPKLKEERMAEEFDEILERARTSGLTQEDREKVKAAMESIVGVVDDCQVADDLDFVCSSPVVVFLKVACLKGIARERMNELENRLTLGVRQRPQRFRHFKMEEDRVRRNHSEVL